MTTTITDGRKEEVLSYFVDRFHLFYEHFVQLPKRSGEVKICSPFRKETMPSFQVQLSGPYQGRWHDFGSGEDGDIFDFFVKIKSLQGKRFPDIITPLAVEFGINFTPSGSTTSRHPSLHLNSKAPSKILPVGNLLRNGHAPANGKPEPTTYPLNWIEGPHQALLHNEALSLDYLTNRGIELETIWHFKLGFGYHYPNGEPIACILIPYLSPDGILLVKKRSVPPHDKAFFREAGMDSPLFNATCLVDKEAPVYICEAELDAITLWQAGFTQVIAVSTGAKHIKDEWIALLEPFQKIVMCYDEDTAGREGRRGLRQRLGEDRVWTVHFQEKEDANAVLVNKGKEELVSLVNAAQPVPIGDVESASQIIEDLQVRLFMGEQIDLGYEWPWPAMTQKFGRIRPGTVIDLSGPPGAGKSICSTNIAAHVVGTLKIPTLLCSLEMTPPEQMTGLIQATYGVAENNITLEILAQANQEISRWPLYFEYHDNHVGFDDILDTFTKAYKRFGVKFFVLDNLHILARAARDEQQEEGRITRGLKLWVEKYNTTVLLIVHPRKIERGKIEGMYDMRGNAAISADADLALTIWRQNQAPENEEDLLQEEDNPQLYHQMTAIIQTKGRRTSGGGRVWLWMEGEYRRFRLVYATDPRPKIRNTRGGKGKKEHVST